MVPDTQARIGTLPRAYLPRKEGLGELHDPMEKDGRLVKGRRENELLRAGTAEDFQQNRRRAGLGLTPSPAAGEHPISSIRF